MALLFLDLFQNALLSVGDPCVAAGTLEAIIIHIIIPPGELSPAMELIIILIVLGDYPMCFFFFQLGTAFGTIVLFENHSHRDGIGFSVHADPTFLRVFSIAYGSGKGNPRKGSRKNPPVATQP
jgi:hypothetical protein